jgi:hypothetical protein
MTEELTSDELQLAIDNIRLEISDDYRSGRNVTTVRLKPAEASELEHIKRNLEVEGRTFHFDAESSKLTVDSSSCPRSLD